LFIFYNNDKGFAHFIFSKVGHWLF